jgi:hypothetical protein
VIFLSQYHVTAIAHGPLILKRVFSWCITAIGIKEGTGQELPCVETKGLTSEASFIMPYFYLPHEIGNLQLLQVLRHSSDDGLLLEFECSYCSSHIDPNFSRPVSSLC